MSDDYRAFLEYLFREYVEPRLGRMRRRWDHPKFFLHEWSYERERLIRATRLLRFAYRECEDEGEIYRTFRSERISTAAGSVRSGLGMARRLSEEAGLLDCFDAHYREIIAGLTVDQFPKEELEVLKETGSDTPLADLEGIVHLLKTREASEHWSEQVLIRDRLRSAEERVEREAKVVEEQRSEAEEEQAPKKKRRWFKGLGQIGQGAALTIADIGLALGSLGFPVSPETQTWGALVSAATGTGMVFTGVGELRGE